MNDTSQPVQEPVNHPIPQHNQPTKQSTKSSKPTIAGALLIIIGIIGIIFSSLMIGGGVFFDNIDDIVFEGFTVTNIKGSIIDSQGNPVDNVSITIDEFHLNAITNSTGRYQIYGIPAGFHTIIIEKTGYNTLIYHTYIIPEGENTGCTLPESNQNTPMIFDNDHYDFQMSMGSETINYGSELPPHEQFLEKFGGWISGLGVVTMICSILAIIGGFFSLQRKRYIMVLLCSIAAIFSIGFGIGMFLAIISLIIVILSSNEFKENNEKPMN